MKKLIVLGIIATTLGACESKVEEEKTGTVVSECPTGSTGSGGGGGASTTEPPPGSCVVSEDCAVPANCVLCPGDDVCKSASATCVEGMCQINQPDCPVGSGGAGGASSTTSAAGAGGASTGGGLPTGGGGGAATTTTPSAGGGGSGGSN